MVVSKVFIDTFGCTFNQADSQIMAGNLVENDFEIVNSIDDADVAIINTCYVKQPTENKVTNRIQKLKDQFPELKVIVSGCMVEIDPKKLNKIAPDTSWIGPHQLNKTTNVVKATLNGEISRECGFSKDTKVGIPKIRFDELIHIIQICEGCLGACSYCCTRFARGTLNSYSISEIKKEAKGALLDGCVEIQLTAQDTAAFGKDTNEKLSNLIKEVSGLVNDPEINNDFRIRVGMMHPNNIGDDLDSLIEAFKHPNVYKFIHIPIQSGSDSVLVDMRRGHTVKEYIKIVNRFKNEIPNLTIATDIIVGYPTEKEEDFKKTAEILRELKPGLIHLSKYRHREGAPSSVLDEIPHEVMKKRSKYLTDIKSEITEYENKELVGSIQKVLVVEKGSKGGFIAKTDSYVPVVIEDVEIGKFVDVKIYEATSTYLKGVKL
ncbi:tRNA-2-methylthio-N(6)-dimethylallyladenosine synthase [bioreactor metagenome]|uniref:tRNA (N(6)-L-threonylcarbamoyladenosine(37)-C(2))-methylthiotransferase n=1 Tax=bioreactor metagenome TaxID=1076179 RepID=A0A644V9S1_9ZZZZ|nr:tRNA (N(6)-L-threonylcarbamoyladenosine(37)-C(2))-methylthiotransferase [Methanobrevibacter sp.]MEA4957364.1 tRNA (N(6)-L-threonylcarbamoyladenosine(37)-C(2))-methylthiotransferase [Methanobrevibacter sp.]